MAENMVAGLFGLTPEMYQNQQYQQDLKRGYELAQLRPGAAAQAGLQASIGQLGRGVAGLMGVEDPQMKIISARQQILAGLDQTNPTSMLEGAKMLAQMGDQQGAFVLADYARKAQVQIAEQQQRLAAGQASLAAASRERFQADPEKVRLAKAVAATRGAEGSPEYITAYNESLEKQMTPTEKLEPKPTIQRLQEYAKSLPVGSPERAEVQAAIKAEGSPKGTSLEVKMPPQEKAERGARGELLVKQYAAVSDQAKVASRTLPALESNLSILDKGFDTGFGTEVKVAGAKVLAALGVPEAERLATDGQTFLANANAAVLQRQLEQKGPQTESDAQRITATGAQFGNTKEANRFLINVAKAQLKRDIDQRNFYDKWWKANSTYDGAEDAWFSGEGGRSLFDRPELKSYRAKTSAAEQIPASQGVSITPIYAKNPQTNQRIMSTDGGKTWQAAR
jgi:hypothetical protein